MNENLGMYCNTMLSSSNFVNCDYTFCVYSLNKNLIFWGISVDGRNFPSFWSLKLFKYKKSPKLFGLECTSLKDFLILYGSIKRKLSHPTLWNGHYTRPYYLCFVKGTLSQNIGMAVINSNTVHVQREDHDQFVFDQGTVVAFANIKKCNSTILMSQQKLTCHSKYFS
jgi:hypothetical protein